MLKKKTVRKEEEEHGKAQLSRNMERLCSKG
jgi:hypothetical protein